MEANHYRTGHCGLFDPSDDSGSPALGDLAERVALCSAMGVCVYPVKGVPDSELDFDAIPLWMRTDTFL